MRIALAAPFVLFGAAVAVENRVFGTLGSDPCQKCLHKVEAACDGPITSSQFNNCFCTPSGGAWHNLTSCVGDKATECPEYKGTILSSWASHCFAYKDDEEDEICVPASQKDDLLLSVADDFCTAFVTPTGSAASIASTASSNATAAATAKTTAASASDTNETSSAGGSAASTAASTAAETTSAPTTSAASGASSAASDTQAAASTSTAAAAYLAPLGAAALAAVAAVPYML